MNDRELLILAAKAAGIKLGEWLANVEDRESEWNGREAYENGIYYWNPLTDDGAALRLIVALPGCRLVLSEVGVTVFLPHEPGQVGLKCDEYASEHDDDLEAATRRAIVRAAAELGKEKQ